MINKKLCQQIQRAYIIPLVLISTMSYSQLQAQIPNQNTVKNSPEFFKRPKLPRNGAPTGRRRAGAGRNPECPTSLTRLAALVPGDGGESFWASTVAEYPTFWFYVPELPASARFAEFVLQAQDGKDVQNVYRTPLTLSGKPGIISITLPPQPQYSLKADKKYHWYFHIYYGDREKTSDNF